MVNFGPLAAEIDPVVWGIPANFSGFRVLAALLHGIQYWASAHFAALNFFFSRLISAVEGNTSTHGVALVQI